MQASAIVTFTEAADDWHSGRYASIFEDVRVEDLGDHGITEDDVIVEPQRGEYVEGDNPITFRVTDKYGNEGVHEAKLTLAVE